MKEIKWEEISMEMISCIGIAKSNSIMAIRAAKDKDYERAEKLIAEADEELTKAHTIHFDIVAIEASGEKLELSLLFVHAEDQLLTTIAMKDLAKEMIEMYKKINN